MQRNDQNQFNQGNRSWPQRDTQDQWSRDDDFRGNRGNYPDQGRAQYEANREEQSDYGRFPGYGQYAGSNEGSSGQRSGGYGQQSFSGPQGYGGHSQGFSSHGMNRHQDFDAQGYTGGFQGHGGSQGYGAGSQSYGGYSGSSQGYSGSGYGGPQGSSPSYGGGWQSRNQGGQRNHPDQGDRSFSQPYYSGQGSQRSGNTGGYPDYQREDNPGGWRSGQMNQGRRGSPPKNYKRSDDRINEEVCENFINGGIDCGCAEVSVKNGVCTLNGEVNSRADKYRMEEMASGVSGVNDVENNLKIKSHGYDSQGSTSGSSSGVTGSSASTFGQGQGQGQSGFGKDTGSSKR